MTGPDPRATPETDHWDRHWGRYADATVANPGHAYRRRLIIRLLGAGAAARSARILDLGCGSGDLLAALAEHFPDAALAGADLSETGLAETAAKVPAARLARFDVAAADAALGELREWASHVVCSEVLEHLDDPGPALANAGGCLRPGGVLVTTVPGGPRTAFDRHIGHRRHYTKAGLRALLEQAGFRVEGAWAAGFPAFNLYRLAVMLRGRRLIDDVGGRPGPPALAAMAAFRGLMPLAFADSPWGWQIAAVALKEGRASPQRGPDG
ncbi:MAG: class I SAM-dependent DNA methyltransferase [Rhodospirillales bacterium]